VRLIDRGDVAVAVDVRGPHREAFTAVLWNLLVAQTHRDSPGPYLDTDGAITCAKLLGSLAGNRESVPLLIRDEVVDLHRQVVGTVPAERQVQDFADCGQRLREIRSRLPQVVV
jgi:hypothetical protein